MTGGFVKTCVEQLFISKYSLTVCIIFHNILHTYLSTAKQYMWYVKWRIIGRDDIKSHLHNDDTGYTNITSIYIQINLSWISVNKVNNQIENIIKFLQMRPEHGNIPYHNPCFIYTDS